MNSAAKAAPFASGLRKSASATFANEQRSESRALRTF
jgi:hypothetical protein